MKGSCLCGEIEFELTNFSGNIYQCHCELCRKQGGSASNTGTIVAAEDLKWLKGLDKIRTWEKDSGFTSSFCTRCGSLVPNTLRKLEFYWVPVGTLEDGPYNIVANIYVESKAQWSELYQSGDSFVAMPETMEFIELLHSRGVEK